MVCREAYGLRDCRGYLKGGLPEEYGDGAVEVISNRKKLLHQVQDSGDLCSGDLERVEIEWRSLISLIAYAPPLHSNRWKELQVHAKGIVGQSDTPQELPKLPELPARQKERFESALSRSVS